MPIKSRNCKGICEFEKKLKLQQNIGQHILVISEKSIPLLLAMVAVQVSLEQIVICARRK